MGNRQRFAFGVVVTGICLVLMGCGGGVSKSEHNALQAELDAAKQDLMDEQAARRQAEADEQAAEAARRQAEADEQAAEAARRQAEADEQAAEAARKAAAEELEEAQQQAQSREANQRAEKLKEAFPGGGASGDLAAITVATASPVAVAAARGSLSLTRPGYSTATLSGTGVRTATLSLTSGGDSGKTVVYTDRELSRPLLVHYGELRDSNDLTRFALTTAPLTLPANVLVSPIWKISHGVPTSLNAVDGNSADNDPNDPDTTLRDDLPAGANDPRTKTSYTGTLHGKSGSFVCDGTTSCDVQITPVYGDLDDGKFPLSSVAVAATDGGALYFKPSGSQTLQLYEGGPVGADSEYMVFGYWREDPTSPAADYNVGVFAQAFTPHTATDNITATYDGTAVGMYVEQDPNNAVDTHRQGEFTADVFLEVSNAAPSTISGTIDDFETTPTGGSAEPRTSARWIVTLAADNSALIGSLPGERSGSWEHTFVRAHEYAADDTPPAVTGTFNTRILDFVHLRGAFGAGKRR